MWIHFGCGLCAPRQWRNFDCSPTLWLQKLPLAGRLIPSGPHGRFPTNVQYGDIVRGLPVPNEAADLLYCSHVLEHLAHSDLRDALRECRRVLRPSGTFRLVLPDLRLSVSRYLAAPAEAASTQFMQETLLGKSHRARGLGSFLMDWLGNSRHLWMWDFDGLANELRTVGFANLRRATYNDSDIDAFAMVEDPDRWANALGIECGPE